MSDRCLDNLNEASPDELLGMLLDMLLGLSLGFADETPTVTAADLLTEDGFTIGDILPFVGLGATDHE